jgi:hypothetical protein
MRKRREQHIIERLDFQNPHRWQREEKHGFLLINGKDWE